MRYLAILILMLAGAVLPAQTIKSQIDSILTRAAIADNTWTILVENESGSSILYSNNPDNPQVPASNTKLWTTSAAFALLGPDHAFETRIYANGTIDGSGALTGDLNLLSEHDITWNTYCLSASRDALDHIANQLYIKGLRSVSGAVRAYGACYYNRDQFDDVRSLGSGYDNSTVATQFRNALIARGISVTGGAVGQTGFSAPGTLYYTHKSSDVLYENPLISADEMPLTLAAACIPLNRVSHNAMADALLFHIGYKLSGTSSLSAGAARVIAFCESIGIDTTGMSMNDGSGLSNSNTFTARQTVDLLRYMAINFPTWTTTLSIGCEDGTISGRYCSPTALRGQVHAKTGSLSRSIALSGYVDHPNYGERFFFSFISNRTSIDQTATRNAIEDAVAVFAGNFQPVAPDIVAVTSEGDGSSARVMFRNSGLHVTQYTVRHGGDGSNFPNTSNVTFPHNQYIIETRTGGQHLSDYTEFGVFSDSVSHSAARFLTSGIGSRWALPNDANGANDRARFTPSALAAGTYKVYMTTYESASANAHDVTLRVFDSKGTRTKKFDLTIETMGDVWFYLDDFNFIPGQGHYVEVDNATQSNLGTSLNSRMVPDAVLFLNAESAASHTIGGIAGGRGYFRVTASNSTGTSPVSATYSASISASPSRVLIVDANDRWLGQAENPTGAHHAFAATTGQAIANHTFDTASNEAVARGEINISEYDALVWITGEESTADETFSSEEQTVVTNYLNGGGSLFVSGAEIGWDLDNRGSSADRAFYENILRHNYVADDANTYLVNPIAGKLLDGVGTIDFSGGAMDINFPDVIAPQSGAELIANYSTGGGAAIQYDSGTYKIVGFGFPFESINSSTVREDVMTRVLNYLIGDSDAFHGWMLIGQ